MDLQLTGKLALVSGSTAGIGYAIAEALAREGANVIVNGRKQASVDAAIAKLKESTGGTLQGFAGDLSTAAAAEACFAAHPGVEVLVNNMGIFEIKPFEEIPDADWTRLFEANVMSGVRLSRLYLAGMKKRDWGRILFVSSESGIQIPAEMVHYGMTKAAQIAVARGIAETVAGTGITVNSVLPGPTKSRGVGDFLDDMAKSSGQTPAEFEKAFFEKVRPTSLIKRFSTPEEVGSLVAYLASPLASSTNGASVRVDGGTVKSAY